MYKTKILMEKEPNFTSLHSAGVVINSGWFHLFDPIMGSKWYEGTGKYVLAQ